MASARYLLRFDDICPTMNWATWERIETLLRRLELRPILAVVPDNRDANLVAGEARTDFWERVREWQACGWSIGLHGSTHVYDTRAAGLIGLNERSEFAGVPASTQAQRLDHGMTIFARQQVRVDCWIAPGHSFDATTLRLLRERGVTTVSDGFFLRPVSWLGCTWVPQQLWRFRALPGGLWTVCYHHNSLNAHALGRLETDLVRFRSAIIGLADVDLACAPPLAATDRAVAAAWLAALRLRRVLA